MGVAPLVRRRGDLLHQAVGEAVAALGHQGGAIRTQVGLEKGKALGQLQGDGLAGVALLDPLLGLGVVLQQLQGQPAGGHGGLEHLVPADLGLQGPQLTFDVVAIVHGDAAAAAGLTPGHGGQEGLERIDALLPVAHRGDHWATQEGLQGRYIDVDATPQGVVHHVQHEGHGLAQLQQLGAQVEVALQVGGIQHVEYQVDLGGGQELGGHPLVIAARRQGVGTGEVHHLQGAALVVEGPAAALHRDARPVAHMVSGAGQGIEQCGFATVGVTRQGDGQGHHTPR